MGTLFDRQLWRQFFALAKPYWLSLWKWRAFALLGALLVLLVCVIGTNVVINYVNADLMTAYSSKDSSEFFRMLMVYAGVFVVSTPIVVFATYCQSKLGLGWRKALTDYFLEKYFQDRAYYHLHCDAVIDSPDEQITQDVRDFCSVAISLSSALVTSVITVVAFVAILWRISPMLVLVCVGYSTAGTLLTMWLGRRVAAIKLTQLKKESALRHNLIHVRNHAESIAFYQGEEHESRHLKQRLLDVVRNFNLLLGWQRNVSFVTQSYNYLVSLIPALIIAPLFFASLVPFGTQAAADGAFGQILAALSLIIASFDDIATFSALVHRLGALQQAVESPVPHGATTIDVAVGDTIALRDVTLTTPSGKRTLVRNLSFELKAGTGLLIVGPSGSGKSSVLRAISGLWNYGSGLIIRPELKDLLFLPQRPYMTMGTLRSQLIYPHSTSDATDDELQAVLVRVNLPELIARVGGLDEQIDFADVLSLGEQQRLGFARMLLADPAIAVLDESTSALDVQNDNRLYELMRSEKKTFISVGHRPNLVQYHETVLELLGEGAWRVVPAADYMAAHMQAAEDRPAE